MRDGLGDILTSIVSDSQFGKRPVARDITAFRSHVLPNVTAAIATATTTATTAREVCTSEFVEVCPDIPKNIRKSTNSQKVHLP